MSTGINAGGAATHAPIFWGLAKKDLMIIMFMAFLVVITLVCALVEVHHFPLLPWPLFPNPLLLVPSPPPPPPSSSFFPCFQPLLFALIHSPPLPVPFPLLITVINILYTFVLVLVCRPCGYQGVLYKF